jgi:molybdenum cofactor cytidylyltransferase
VPEVVINADKNQRDLLITDLFAPKPGHWGLRGDPHLWDELVRRFAYLPLPASAEDLRALLEEGYERLTGQALESDDHVRVSRYGTDGMSGGLVSPKFWRTEAIPLLLARHAACMGDDASTRPA